jgi:hypothetical protein
MTYKNKTLTNVYTAYEEISSIIIMKVNSFNPTTQTS